MASLGLFYTLLVFAPLARGGSHTWTHCVMALLTLAGLTTAWLARDPVKEAWRSPLAWPTLVFALLAVISTLWANYRPAAVDAFLLGGIYVGVYVWAVALTRKREDRRRLVYVILGVAGFISLIGFLKVFELNPFPWWEYDLRQDRLALSGTFGNRNHLAGYLEMSLPLLYGLFLWKSHSPGAMASWIGLGIFILMAHILSLSRGGWFSMMSATFFFVLVLMARSRLRYRKWAIAGLVGLVLLGMFILINTHVVERITTMTQQEPDRAMSGRLEFWEGTIRMIRENPLIGVGPGGFAEAYLLFETPGCPVRVDYAHNDYLQFIAEYGLAGLAILVWAMVILFRSGFHKIGDSSRLVRGVSLGALSGLVAIMVHSFSDFNLHLPANAILVSVLAAMATGPLPTEQRRQKHKHQELGLRSGPAVRRTSEPGAEDVFS